MRKIESIKLGEIRETIRNSSNGIWVSQIAKLVQRSPATVRYYIYGRTQRGQQIGGYLADEIIEIKTEGSNKKLKLKSNSAIATT